MQYGYWATNLGGLVTSTISQQTGDTFEDNKRYAKIAEEVGFDYTLIATRFQTPLGKGNLYDAFAMTSALAAVTSELKLITAVLTGLWNPGTVAKIVSTIDHISNGRAAVNIVSGWNKGEFHALGEHWLDHDERYRRSEEFIEVLLRLWTKERPSYSGDFFRIRELAADPQPVQKPYPPIYQAGSSNAAKQMAAKYADFHFMNGNTVENLRNEVEDIQSLAATYGRNVKFGVNAFVILRDTEEEAFQVLEEIIEKAHPEAVAKFRKEVQNGGKSSPEGKGLWANSTFRDLVQANDGFKTGLIGTAEQIADKIIELKRNGIDSILTGFLHYDWELQAFGEQVIPLVRKKERELELVKSE